jgi:hypothetical protein
MRRIILVLALCALSLSNALAQGGESGFYVGGQLGFEVMGYSEYFTNSNKEPGQLSGNSTSLAAAIALEYDFQKKFKIPLTLGLSGGAPLKSFEGTENGTFVREGQTFLSQREDVIHSYHFLRGTIGAKITAGLQPFVIFERSLFESRRFNMLEGTDEGTLVRDPANNDWLERVWSSHVGAGLGGKLDLTEDKKFSFRYRAAAMWPIAVFVTNDHPEINDLTGKLGKRATGWTILSRIALHYQLRERVNVSLGVNYYRRRWKGNGAQSSNAYWPKNDMYAIPVLLGFTWSI